MASVERTDTAPVIAEDALGNAVVSEESSLGVRRYFTIPGRDPFDEVEWEIRDALIPGKDGPAFEQKDVEFPKFWSQTATNIVAQKYFRGRMSSPERESSVKQMIGRIVSTAGRVGPRGRLLRRRGRGADVRGRAEGDPREPARVVQLARCGSTSASRRSRSARPASSSRSTTRWTRSSTGSAARASSSAAARAPGSTSRACARARSSSPRAATRPARSASCAAPTPPPARSSPAARRGARRRWSSSTSSTRTSRSSSGARRTRRRRPASSRRPATTCRSTRPTGRRSSTRTRTTRCASPTRSWRPPTQAPTGT